MKATKIYYEELRTSGSYNNKKVGIEIEIAEGEKAADVFKKAKLFVQACLSSDSVNPQLLENIVRRMHEAQHSIDDFVKKAQEALPLEDEIPF
jgi:hypothetical protein